MALNFNVNPYYDDFDEDKNFHRILFRPGRAVQARELTQAQTILQNQIDRFGSHIFKEGSKVTGAETFDEIGYSVKLQPTFDGNAIDISSYSNYYVRANTSNNVYQVKQVAVADDVDPDTLFLSFIKNIGVTSGSIGRVFGANTSNASISNSENLIVYSTPDLSDSNIIATVITTDEYPTFRTRLYSVANGVFFTNGLFVRNDSQTVVASKYTEFANVSVGFDVNETLIDSGDDTSLLDPAVGASNYFAPGADRYKVSLTLTTKELIDDSIPDLTTEKYIEVARYRNGNLVKDTRAANYADLLETLARRTFDESGNYRVDGLDPRIKPEGFSGANSQFALQVSPGKAYVFGFENELISRRELAINKARDFESVEGYDVPTYYGNYFFVTNANGAVFNFSTAEKLELHSSNTAISANTKLGEVYARNLEYVSGNGDSAVYKLSLFDVKQTSNNPIKLTKTIINGNAATYTANVNIASDSVFTRTTTGTVSNTSNIITISTLTGITNGMEIFGPNVPVGTFITSIDGSQVTMSNAAVGNNSSEIYLFRESFLTDRTYDCSVFEASYDVIKQFSNVDYDAKRVFKSVSFTAGVASIQTNDGTERFNPIDGANLQRNYAICIRTGGTGSFPNFTWVDLSAGSYLAIPTPSVGSPATLNIDLGDATFNGTADILATIDITGGARRTKTYVSDAVKYFNQYTANTLSLGYADVVNVTAIYISNDPANAANAQANTNVVDSFTLDNGQRDSFYDHATITVKTGETVNTGNVLVIYNRFDHSGTGFFDTGSYSDYDNIPTYRKRDGTIIDLRDSLDFRPIRTANATSNVANSLNMVFNSQLIVDSTVGSADTDLEYYLARKDKVVLNKNGQFRVIEGTSAQRNPPTPTDEPDAMTLYTLSLDPYTYNTSNVKVSIAKNRRYTMRDIGSLDDRLTRVEYYTALNLLEKDIATTVYFDDQDNQLFNNGFLVDSFRGHGVGDIFSADYKCSVDFDNEILHPRFDSNGTFLTVSTKTLTETGNVFTLPFTTADYIKQNVASESVNVNPFNVIGFIGYVKLEKTTSPWVDFNTRPDVVINESGDADNYQYGVNFRGSQWGDWNVLSYANDPGNIVYTYYSQSGQKVQRTTSKRVKEEDSSIIENRILQYTPNTAINFELYGMRPNTEMTVYLDGVQLSGHLRIYDSANTTYNANTVITNTNGYVKGQLIVPNDDIYKFSVGKNHLFFCDNRVDRKRFSTLAETFFYSAEPPKPVAKPVPEPIRNVETQVDVIRPSPSGPAARQDDPPIQPNSVYNDTVAPTHTTQNAIAIGAAGTGSGRLGGSTDHIEFYERNTGSSYTPPGSSAAAANLSAAGGSDFIVGLYETYTNQGSVMDTAGYNYWASVVATGVPATKVEEAFRAAARDLNDGKDCKNKDPIAQTFFVNPYTNSNGIFIPSIDIFFATKDETGIPVTLEIRDTVNGYPSSTGFIASVTLNPDQVTIPADPNVPEATTFTFDQPVYLEPGEYAFVVLANSQEYNVYVGTIGGTRLDNGETIVSQPYVGSLFKSQNGSTWTAEQNSDICFVIKQCKFTTGLSFNTVLTPTALGYTQLYDVARLNIPYEVISPSANISFELGTKANGSASLGNYLDVIPNSEIYLQNRKTFATAADANVRISMRTTDADISPVFDVSKSSIVLVKNLVDSTAAANVTSFPETLASGGGAESKYSTRKVTLNEGFDATSLRVYLQQNLPAGSSFQIFYKVQAAEDTGVFDTKPWVQMTLNGTSTNNQNINEYYDYEYRADNISYTFDGVTYDNFRSFAIKVVFFSTNPANAPTAKNLRVIALS